MLCQAIRIRQPWAHYAIGPVTMEGFYRKLDYLYAQLEMMERSSRHYSKEEILTVIKQIRDLRAQNPFRK